MPNIKNFVVRQLSDETATDGVVVDLQDGGHVRALPYASYDALAIRNFESMAALREAVEIEVVASGEEWQRERGPDSALAQGMEAGTPTVNHSNDR